MDNFINEVKKYLNVLSPDIVTKEIENLKTNLNGDYSKVKAKDVAKDILVKYNVNPNIVFKKENFIKRKMQDLVEAFNHLLEIMGQNDFKSNLKIVLDILILLAFISLCKIPFIAIRNIGESLLNSINVSYAYDIWALAIELVYIIVAIMIFINVFPKWFKNLKPNPNHKAKQPVKEEQAKPEKIGNDLESISLTSNEKANNEK